MKKTILCGGTGTGKTSSGALPQPFSRREGTLCDDGFRSFSKRTVIFNRFSLFSYFSGKSDLLHLRQ